MIFKSRVALYYQNNDRCRILFDAIYGKMFNNNIMIMYVFVTSSYQYFFYLRYAKSLFKNYIFDFFILHISILSVLLGQYLEFPEVKE